MFGSFKASPLCGAHSNLVTYYFIFSKLAQWHNMCLYLRMCGILGEICNDTGSHERLRFDENDVAPYAETLLKTCNG